MARKALLIILIMAVGSLWACKNADPNVVASVNGVDITLEEFRELFYEKIKPYEESGVLYNLTEEEEAGKLFFDSFREEVLDELIGREAVRRKAEKEGYFKYTSQMRELAELEADRNIEKQIKEIEKRFKESFRGQTAPADFYQLAKEKFWAEAAKENKTRETYITQELERLALERFYSNNLPAIGVEQSEVESLYNKLLSEQKAVYESDNELFEKNYKDNSVIVYYPEDYVLVKYILISFPQDALNNIKMLVDNADSEAEKAKEADPSYVPPEFNKRYRKALEYRDNALQSIEDKARKILNKATQGADFDSLIDQYSDDTQFYYDVYKEKGYPVNIGQIEDPDYKSAIMDLAPGEVSGLVPTFDGYKIIKLQAWLAPGAVGFESVKGALEARIKSQKQDKAMRDFNAECIKGQRVKKYPEVYSQVKYEPQY
ncbi:MAG TPA: peptidylprolyl isomerase [Clostridia bacterium]|nr:peptidylprolyl isomerase [Clostridia bacterium]